MGPYGEALDARQKQIRRLVLEPASTGSTLRCSTETVSLLDQPEYEALSYVWGDAAIRQDIIFEGDRFSVTENLAVALRNLRMPNTPRRLWVDALCINQNNTKERNEQVQLMGEIYAGASPVVIWLGEASEEHADAFTLISQIADGKEISENDSQELFAFYMELVKRQWFTRLWTVQEMVLANYDPLVAYGSARTTWSLLFGVWKKVALTEFTKMGMVIWQQGASNGTKDDEDLGVRLGAIKIDLLNNLRAAVASTGGEELRNLLLNTNSSNATEPRDRIYALIGMMKKEHRDHFKVDYERPLGIVYAEAVAHIFRKGHGPFSISGMELAGSSSPSPDSSFPSWVPIFGAEHQLGPTRFHPSGVGASGAGSSCENGTVGPDLKTLRVRGLSIDTVIDKISFGEGNECLSRLDEVETLVNKAHQIAQLNSHHRPYLNTFKVKEPVWRTLIANKAYSGARREVAPESYGEMYELLLRSSRSGLEVSDEFVRDYRLSLLNYLPSGCFFVTATGFYGIGQGALERGDQLAIWFGSPVPFILRPHLQGHTEHGKLVHAVCGVAYVAGIMEGEMVDEVYCEDLEDDVEFIVR